MEAKLFILDVDGTMTDGGIYYDENGNELKKFCTKDAAGFFAVHAAGAKILVLTGRKCAATEKRMNELKVDYLFQNVKEKSAFIKKFCEDNNIKLEEIVYIGDDLNDLDAMKMAGYVGCPADSCKEVRQQADYISAINGGYGAVRDVIEHIYRLRGEWESLISKVYVNGI